MPASRAERSRIAHVPQREHSQSIGVFSHLSASADFDCQARMNSDLASRRTTMRRRAISTWTLHGQLQGQLDLLELPAQIARRGISALEICHFHLPSTTPDYLAALRDACQTAGVETYSILIDTGDIAAPDP